MYVDLKKKRRFSGPLFRRRVSSLNTPLRRRRRSLLLQTPETIIAAVVWRSAPLKADFPRIPLSAYIHVNVPRGTRYTAVSFVRQKGLRRKRERETAEGQRDTCIHDAKNGLLLRRNNVLRPHRMTCNTRV